MCELNETVLPRRSTREFCVDFGEADIPAARGWGIALFALSLSACTVESECPEPAVTRGDPIKVADGTLAETDVVEPVVVAILLDGPAGPRPTCTGTRIARGVVLTAGHCVRDVGMDELSVRTAEGQALALEATRKTDGCAPGGLAPGQSFPVLDMVRHHESDLAVLYLAEAADLPSAVRARVPLANDQPAAIAGFGTTETLERGTLRAIEVDVLSVTAQWITIQARGGGACTGDSGGPLYTWSEGRLMLHGVLSRGSATCYGKDDYVPLLGANEWIDTLLAQ